jgi:hypothetical protein
MSVIACPRHGVVDVSKDAPCPSCGVAAYDLDDRNARDVVRQNRELALKTRKFILGAVVFVGVALAADVGFVLRDGTFTFNLLAPFCGAIAAAFAARPLALKVEPVAALRRLDEELTRRKV